MRDHGNGLPEQDISIIAFVGNRYCWSTAMLGLLVGVNELTEPEAWALNEAIDADADGNHQILPMLDHDSELAAKILAFCESIV